MLWSACSTPSHPEYGPNQAPTQYIKPYLHVDVGKGPCGNKAAGGCEALAAAQRRNLSGMVAAMDGDFTPHPWVIVMMMIYDDDDDET